MDVGTKYLMVRSAEKKNIAEFSAMCSLSAQNYGEIERNEKKPSQKAKEKIESIIDNLGWELLEDGVAKREKTFLTFDGELQFHELFKDIDRHLSKGDELLIDGAVESKTTPDIMVRVMLLREKGVEMRHLISEGDHNLRAPLDEYRCIPNKHFINQAIFIYNGTVAIHSQEEKKIIILRDKNFYLYHRKKFNVSWGQHNAPRHTTSEDLFDV